MVCWNENNVEEAGSGKHPPYVAMHQTQLRGGEHFIKNKIFIYSMDETWEDVLKAFLEDWKYKAFKCKKKKKKIV